MKARRISGTTLVSAKREDSVHAFVCVCVCVEASEGGTGGCGRGCSYILMGISWILIILSFPFSLLLCIKVS